MSTVSVECAFCRNPFEKRVAEFNRSVCRNANHFCSRSCSASFGNTIVPRGTNNLHRGFITRDEFTPFRYFLAVARNRKRTKDGQSFDLTLKHLKQLWESQEGVCPFTGWKLNLPLGTRGFKEKRHFKNASLDRVDGSKGYQIGNVRYVAFIFNVARCDFPDKDVLTFCRSVVECEQKKTLTAAI